MRKVVSLLAILALTGSGLGLFSPFDANAGTTDRIITSFGRGSANSKIKAYTVDGSSDSTTSFDAFSNTLKGGANVATGDIDGDGSDEIIVGGGIGNGPHLRVFERDGTQRGIQFFAFHPNFRGGMSVAAGDVDGDGVDEIGVCQASAGQAWFKVYEYNDEHTVRAYGNAFGKAESGCSIAMGDVDGDGKAEVIIGAGPGGGPLIRMYDILPGQTALHPNQGFALKPVQFFAFDKKNRSGINVAVGDIDGDGRDEIGAIQGFGDQPWVKVFRYNSQPIAQFRADTSTAGGHMAFGDVDHDGKDEIIVGTINAVQTYELDGTLLEQFTAEAATRTTNAVHPAFAKF